MSGADMVGKIKSSEGRGREVRDREEVQQCWAIEAGRMIPNGGVVVSDSRGRASLAVDGGVGVPGVVFKSRKWGNRSSS